MKVISVENVSKRFKPGQTGPGSIADIFRVIGVGNRSRRKQEPFWALSDVSFSVERGEALGIIGPNGAGKSTILKLLTGIMEPTSGRIRTRGRVSALIEVGAGFHMEMTGRENIYLNGTILVR
jgi:ABC-type polysaccharide/polyol phosphate transport system ATPase subunit